MYKLYYVQSECIHFDLKKIFPFPLIIFTVLDIPLNASNDKGTKVICVNR